MRKHRKQIQQHPGAAAIADRVVRQRAGGHAYGIMQPETGERVKVQGEEYPDQAAFFHRYPYGQIIQIVYEETHGL